MNKMALSMIVSDILWNLDVLGAVTNHQTLLVLGDKLAFDNRYLQWVRRPISGESRSHILSALEKTFGLFEEVLQSYQSNTYVNTPGVLSHEQSEIADNILINLRNLMERRECVTTGLNTLMTFERYNHDSAFKIEMNRFMERMERLCKKCQSLTCRIEKTPLRLYHSSPIVPPDPPNSPLTALSLMRQESKS